MPQPHSTPPILLLKTKSTPTDPYDTLLSSAGCKPIFIPVLKHRAVNADVVRGYILDGLIGGDVISDSNTDQNKEEEKEKKEEEKGEDTATITNDDKDVAQTRKFAALIITSQRAVEALGSIIDELKESHPKTIPPLLHSTKIYIVGPATKNSLINLGFTPSNILGEDSGNGAVLADFIVEDWISTFPPTTTTTMENAKKARNLLFLTGETHSTTIPTRVPEKIKEITGEIVTVEEVVVYKTGVVDGFEGEFRRCLEGIETAEPHDEKEDGNETENGKEEEEITIWIIFFSPTGTDAALKVLQEREKLGNNTVEVKNKHRYRYRYKCCTIGPTTKDYMYQRFKRKPDAMAKTPSPEGVLEAVRHPGRVAAELVT